MRGHRVFGMGDQVQKPLGRGRHTNHQRHLHQPHFRVTQQKTLHQGLGCLRTTASGHAPVCLINHHIKPVRNRQRSISQRFPNQVLPSIAPVCQRLIDCQFLRIDEIDTPTIQPRRVEMRIDGDELVDPVHLVGLALDLELSLLVEFGHV